MNSIGLELALIGLLILANGVFSMAEMAVVSSRKARLRQRAHDGSKGAVAALHLAENPHDFLSTVQVGITLIGTLAGAFGGATVAEKLSAYLKTFPDLARHSETFAITIVVVIITYFSLIIGELVPKSLALSNAEGIASVLARPMVLLARIGSPVVAFLTLSTKVVTKLLPFKPNQEAPVTEEEVKVLIAQGTEHGTFEEAEQEMVEGVFRLGDRRVIDLMKPRGRVTTLDATDTWDNNRAALQGGEYSRFPVIDGDPDRIVGIVHLKDIFLASDPGQPPDLPKIARRALFIPEFTPALDLLERFQETGDQMALVVDEHGGFQGIVTLTDLLESIVGDLRGPTSSPKASITRREDGSWLADGALQIASLLDPLELRSIPGDEDGFSTVAGFFLAHFRHIPAPGDHIVVDGWRFEILDMDRNRIDKVLIARIASSPETPTRR